ncbi:MAG: N-acetylmuramoyl-L-alanine amidase [Alphaproteobacteria bacterium]
MRIRALLTFLSAFVLCGLLTVQSALALSVNDVRFGTHPGKTRLVFDLSAVSDFRAFTLSDPYRLVIDLPAFDWRVGNVPANDGAGITAVRHGNLEAGISRIVLDLNRPINIENAFVLPAAQGKSNRLVVDIADVSHAAFIKGKGQSYGTLEIQKHYLKAPAEVRTAALNAPAPFPPGKPKTLAKKPLIIIDPGHGGVDPGAVGANGVYEKNVALALAKELKSQLLATGRYRVKMTREDDRFIKLGDRVHFARNNGGDLFMSIHADSLPRPNVRGASVYTLSNKASDAQTAKLAARENKADLIAGIDLSVEDDEVANILVNLAMRDTMNQSKYFANTLVEEMQLEGVKLLERPHRYAGFAVLKAPDIPSVLVEAGFMSNKSEANMLTTHEHRRKIAGALRDGINAYFKTVAENERS